jgi:hypothetical protein
MSINQEIPNEDLLNDLLSEEDGDETTNRVRKLIKQRYISFGQSFKANMIPAV